MENLLEDLKAWVWASVRNITHLHILLKRKSPLCQIGFHKMRRGFGWSREKRFDVCLRDKCKYSKWHNDKIGNQLMKIQS